MKRILKSLVALFLCVSNLGLHAQTPYVVIDTVLLEGHRKTNDNYILQSINFEIGDTIALEQLMPILNQNQKLLFNTRLFQKVEMNVAEWNGHHVSIRISMIESWYIYPIPIFELADRNITVWLQQHNASTDRINYGLWAVWRNLFGWNDQLTLVTQFGYTRKFELEYEIPPTLQGRKFGFLFNALFSDNKEINYLTVDDQQIFFRDFSSSERQFRRIRGEFYTYYQHNTFTRSTLELNYLDLQIGRPTGTLNPIYFQGGRLNQRSFSLRYQFEMDRRNNVAYPTKGFMINTSITKKGLGIFNDVNLLFLEGEFGYFSRLSDWLSISNLLFVKAHLLPNEFSYFDNRAIGYKNNYVRGYELYVVEAQHFIINRTDVNFKILDIDIPLLKKSSFYYFRELPLKLHTRLFFDYAYSWINENQTSNTLNNSSLFGAGVGLDIIFYAYDFIIQIEYSFNKTGENGLYLRYIINF